MDVGGHMQLHLHRPANNPRTNLHTWHAQRTVRISATCSLKRQNSKLACSLASSKDVIGHSIGPRGAIPGGAISTYDAKLRKVNDVSHLTVTGRQDICKDS